MDWSSLTHHAEDTPVDAAELRKMFDPKHVENILKMADKNNDGKQTAWGVSLGARNVFLQIVSWPAFKKHLLCLAGKIDFNEFCDMLRKY